MTTSNPPYRGKARSLAIWFSLTLLFAHFVANVLAFMEAWAVAAVVLLLAGALVGRLLPLGWKGPGTMGTLFLVSQVLIFRLPHIIGADLPSYQQLAWDGRLAVIRLTVAWTLAAAAGMAILGSVVGWRAAAWTVLAFAAGGAVQGLLTETVLGWPLSVPVPMAIGGFVLAHSVLTAIKPVASAGGNAQPAT